MDRYSFDVGRSHPFPPAGLSRRTHVPHPASIIEARIAGHNDGSFHHRTKLPIPSMIRLRHNHPPLPYRPEMAPLTKRRVNGLQTRFDTNHRTGGDDRTSGAHRPARHRTPAVMTATRPANATGQPSAYSHLPHHPVPTGSVPTGSAIPATTIQAARLSQPTKPMCRSAAEPVETMRRHPGPQTAPRARRSAARLASRS